MIPSGLFLYVYLVKRPYGHNGMPLGIPCETVGRISIYTTYNYAIFLHN